MFQFAHPSALYLLLAIPVMIAIFIWSNIRRRRMLNTFSDTALLTRLFPDFSKKRGILKFVFLILAWAFLVIVLAEPQTGSKLEKIQRRGIDLVFALDVSNSMLAQDLSPNRLERAKQSIVQLLGQMENDKIGLVTFAGKAYIQMPVTADYSAARLFLSNINPGMIPVQGTAIGDAIETATNCFGVSKQSKAIIVISDGENHEDDAVEAARKAAGKGIRVYTIGIGNPEGAPIPVYSGNTMIGYKKDNTGATVISKLNEDMLREIARAGDGSYVHSGNTQNGVKEIFDQISKLEKKEYSTAVYSDYDDRFQYFAAIGLFFLIAEFLIGSRKGRWAGKFDIFKQRTQYPEA